MTVSRLFFRIVPLLLASASFLARAEVPPPPPQQDFQRQQVNLTLSDCHQDSCPRLRANWPVFPKDASLSVWIDKQLAEFATSPVFEGDCAKPVHNLQGIFDHFEHEPADVHKTCALYGKVKWESPKVVVFNLNVGADRHWASRSVVYDRAGKKTLTLDDILLPGAKDRFQAQFADAEASAFDAGSTDCPWPRSPGNSSTCEFPAADEFEVDADGITLVYALPPKVPGGDSSTMTFHASYTQLKGILKPEWLPTP